MSKKIFSNEEIDNLSKSTRIIFEETGFDITVIGLKRIECASDRWKKANPYKRIAKATKEHRVVLNLLNRNFK